MQALVGAGATGVSALVDDGHGVGRFALGSARLDPPLALRPADQFRWSITKTAVSVVALQLAEQGRLSLRDSIESWLPHVVPNGSAITLRMLLNHTSGIFNYTDDPDFLATVFAHPTGTGARASPSCRDLSPAGVRAGNGLVVQQHQLHPCRPGAAEGHRQVGR